MSVHFISSGQKTFVEKLPNGIRSLVLKPKLYSLEFSKDEGFYLLDIADRYTLPVKIYGNYKAAAERVIKTHYSKKGNTGVLLTGPKGTGKSLFVKFIANAMIDLNVPVIQINKPFHGNEIFNFIESIGDCVLLFDEFGKNYNIYNEPNGPTQVGLLSLLDGLGNSKRLHLFTENSVSSISEYMINRPGRIHYHFKYTHLSEEIIREYCAELSIPESIVEELLSLSSKLKVLSFDTVSCLINEWLLYGGKLSEHLDILNISLRKDPNNGDIEVLSFIRKNGTIISPKDIKVDFRNNFINILLDIKEDNFSSKEHLEPLNIDDAILVKNNIYKFISRADDQITLKINNIY